MRTAAVEHLTLFLFATEDETVSFEFGF